MLVRRDRPMIARLQVARIRVPLYIGGGLAEISIWEREALWSLWLAHACVFN